jgi:hypothetical protein
VGVKKRLKIFSVGSLGYLEKLLLLGGKEIQLFV